MFRVDAVNKTVSHCVINNKVWRWVVQVINSRVVFPSAVSSKCGPNLRWCLHGNPGRTTSLGGRTAHVKVSCEVRNKIN